MQKHDPKRQSTNPREIVSHYGWQALGELLATTGYLAQRRPLRDLGLSLRRWKPQLLGGLRGAGKTALAEALVEACNLTKYYIQGVEGMGVDEAYCGWDRASQESAVRLAISSGKSPEEALKDKWQKEFLDKGEVLESFDYASRTARTGEPPPVLIVDEVEKLSVTIQNTFLQPFGRGFAEIPKLEGYIGVKDRTRMPIIILTSNNTKILTEPLKSRCLYTWMDAPTPQEEVRILRARVPQAAPDLVAGVAKVINYIRTDMPHVRDKPGLRESIEWLEALVDDGVRHFDEDVIDEYLGLLGKEQKEQTNLWKGLGRLAEAANFPHGEIDGWTATVFAQEIGSSLNESFSLMEAS